MKNEGASRVLDSARHSEGKCITKIVDQALSLGHESEYLDYFLLLDPRKLRRKQNKLFIIYLVTASNNINSYRGKGYEI